MSGSIQQNSRGPSRPAQRGRLRAAGCYWSGKICHKTSVKQGQGEAGKRGKTGAG